jgi:hypothetical protein
MGPPINPLPASSGVCWGRADDLWLLRLVAPLTGRHCPFAHIDTRLPGLGGRFPLP